jgi:hypothetical protein
MDLEVQNMVKKTDIVRAAVARDDFKEALRIAKDFRINITKEQRSTMARAYECLIYPGFYQQIGTDIQTAISEGVELVTKLYGPRANKETAEGAVAK